MIPLAKSSSHNGALGPMRLDTHAHDAAWFMKELLEKWASKHTKEFLCQELDLSWDCVLNVAQWLAAVHDVGKIIPKYQDAFSGKTELIKKEKEDSHDMVGEYVTDHWLTSKGLSSAWSSVIGAHHGWSQDRRMGPTRYVGLEYLLGNDAFHRSRVSFLEDMHTHYIGEDSSLENTPTTPALMILSGFLIWADWEASAHTPSTEEYSVGRQTSLPSPRENFPDIPFAEMWGKEPRPFQQALLDSALEEPALDLVQAPTGEGKSAAAISLASSLVSRMGLNGVVFALPTKATASILADQVMIEWVEKVNSMLWLAHSSAYYHKNYMEISNAHKGLRTQLRVFSPVWLGTVDQVLMMSIRSKRCNVRHAALSGKVLIFDEVHSYDPYVSRILDDTIKWAARYKIPVIVLSATLPSSRRSAIVKAYTGRDMTIPESTICVITKESRQLEKIPSSRPEASFTLQRTRNTPVTDIISEAKSGSNVLVICNRVARAIELYQEVSKIISDTSILHSRYTQKDRARKEEELFQRFGSEVITKPKGAVLISTQVVEQSADLDFDVLVTDLCPIDRLIQRMGRVYRNRDVERVSPKVIVAEDVYDSWLYTPWILEQTRDSLPTTLSLPTDIEDLLNKVYEEDRHPELYQEHVNKAYTSSSSASRDLIRMEGNTLRGRFPRTQEDLSVREDLDSVSIILSCNGGLMDGTLTEDASDSTKRENSVSVHSSWGFSDDQVVEIRPEDYTVCGLQDIRTKKVVG